MLLNSFKIIKDRQKKFGVQSRRRSQQEKITVIVRATDDSNCLSECIDSIRCQTYANLEIIVIFDGAKESMIKNFQSVARRDNRIAILAQEKTMGVAYTRNTGLGASTGDYIAFVEASDCIEKNMFDTLKRACDVNRADIAVCDYSYLHTDDIRRKSKYANGETEIISGKEFDMCYFLYPDTLEENISVNNKLFKKKLFADIKFPDGSHYSEEATTFKLVNTSERVVYIHEPLYVKRVTGNNIDETLDLKQYALFDAYVERLKFYEANALFDMMWYTMKKVMNRLHGYRHKAKEYKTYDKKTSQKYHKILKDYYKRNKDNMTLSSRDKKQISLFCFSFEMYCVVKDLYN
jgi:glycosyltransferase involved in cell wall biosynthesis